MVATGLKRNRRTFYALLTPAIVLATIAVVFAANIQALVELGQPNFTSSGFGATATQNGLALPYGVAVDRISGHLYIADTANNRVLGWSSVSALSNGAVADLVIGQTNFTSDSSSGGASGLNSPWSVAVDSQGNLYVSDNGNNRVLEYNSPYNAFGHSCTAISPCEGGLAANLVLGQGAAGNSFATSSGCSTKSDTSCLDEPSGITIDSDDNLYIADTLNDRVVVFLNPLGTPTACQSSGCAGDVIADYSLGECTGNSGFLDGQANCNHPAVSMLGPNAVAVDSAGNTFVADTQNNRVLEFNNPAGTGNLAANRAYGGGATGSNFTPAVCSNGFGADPSPSAISMCSPAGLLIDSSNNLYVSDYGNSRILEFANPLTNFTANLVIGQDSLGSNFTTGVCHGGQPGSGSGNSASATGLCNPAGLDRDASNNLFVADANNSRMIEFSDPAASPSATATASASASATASPTATATVSATAHVTPSSTSSPSATATASPTRTATASATATITVTPSATSTATSTKTATPTATSTPGVATTLTAKPPTLNFGKVDATGTSKPEKVTLTNKGTVSAQISTMSATTPFKLAGGSDTCSGQTIAPKKTCSFDVEFAPATVANFTGGAIKVTYNGASPTVALGGDGVAPALKITAPRTFPGAAAGATGSAKNITITNNSSVPVQLGAASAMDNFRITSDQCANVSLAPKAKCVVAVEFAPEGGTSGTLSSPLKYAFTYGANSGSVSITLKGKVK